MSSTKIVRVAKSTKSGAVTITKPNSAQAPAAPVAATPTPATPAAPNHGLRGVAPGQSIGLTGKPYRVGAPHTSAHWAALVAVLQAGPQPVTALVGAASTQGPVPGHFVGYVLRRGYLQTVA